MRVLVTGGAGFIGSAVVDALVHDDHDVVVLDATARYRNADAAYVIGDVRDGEAVRQSVRGVDAVCHQAAKVGLGVDFADTTGYVSHNDLGTAVLLESLHARKFRGRIVLASSMVVYGEGRHRCAEHGVVRAAPRSVERLDRGLYEPACPSCGQDLVAEAVDEGDGVDPRNVYAATKLHQEHLCQAYAREHGASLVSLRYHNVYGPRMPDDTPYAGVAALFRSAIARGEPPRVLEDGGQRRDFVHVSDVARANVLALCAPPERSGAYNVASGSPRTVLDLATALCDSAGTGLGPAVVGGYRLGDVRHVFASPERAARGLGFRAQVELAEGVRQLIVRNQRDMSTTALAVPPTVPVTLERPTRAR
jgi:dTDP-L-rhamnose 4-epimerase